MLALSFRTRILETDAFVFGEFSLICGRRFEVLSAIFCDDSEPLTLFVPICNIILLGSLRRRGFR